MVRILTDAKTTVSRDILNLITPITDEVLVIRHG